MNMRTTLNIDGDLLRRAAELLDFVERRRLFGRGIGWIDAHLLASAVLSNARLMTLHRRLAGLGASLGIAR